MQREGVRVGEERAPQALSLPEDALQLVLLVPVVDGVEVGPGENRDAVAVLGLVGIGGGGSGDVLGAALVEDVCEEVGPDAAASLGIEGRRDVVCYRLKESESEFL